MSLSLNTVVVTTSPYTMNKDDTLFLVNRTSPSSVILPTMSNSNSEIGKSFYIKDASGTSTTNPITITAPSSKTINGVSFAMLNGAYSHIQVAYDGTNWLTIA